MALWSWTMRSGKINKQIDLRASEYREHGSRWAPPLGNDPVPGEKPHIWQEFKRDMHKQRYADEPVLGRGWPLLIMIALMLAALTFIEINGGPEWLIAIKNLF